MNLRPELLHRPRRLRYSESIRSLVRETWLHADDFMMPLFVVPGSNIKNEIGSMPGMYHHSIDRLSETIERLVTVGIRSIVLFGIPDFKDAEGTDSLHDDGIIQRAVRTVRKEFPDLYVATDVCLCEYTDHGHCGILENETVNNDRTLPLLQKQAVSHARAGAHMVAPSGMMDGMVGAIRSALDAAGFTDVALMSYAVKYASAYYGPFREAAQSAPQVGDRRAYQMDPANRREAIREALLDVEEGADVIMVKPALAYLDVLREVADTVDLPIACYNVSGEYSMIKAAAAAGLVDGDRIMMETLTSMKRAGADIILTYFAEDAARLLKNSN